MFHDADYVKWANENTIHVLSYSLDPNAEGPEPTKSVERERDGEKEKVEVLALYPMFTANEAEALVNEVNAGVKFPTHTPWVGVISPDGSTVLASGAKGTSKQYRELYEAEQKKLGAPVPRDAWKKAVAALEASGNAEFDGAWKKAVETGLAAKAAVPTPPPPLAERITTRLDALEKAGRARIAEAKALKDPAARAKALAEVRAAFAGLACAADAKD